MAAANTKKHKHTRSYDVFYRVAQTWHFLRATAYAIARIGLCYRPSVCLSVCHTSGSYKNGWS